MNEAKLFPHKFKKQNFVIRVKSSQVKLKLNRYDTILVTGLMINRIRIGLEEIFKIFLSRDKFISFRKKKKKIYRYIDKYFIITEE